MYHKCLGHIEIKENPLKHPPPLKIHGKKGPERKTVQEEKELKRHILQMLQLCNFEQELQKKYKDVSVKYDISKNFIKFEGLSCEVTNAIVEMYEFVSKVAKNEVKMFSKLLQQFLQQQPVYMYVNSKMKERNIVGVWEFFEGEETFTIFSMSNELAVQAADLIIESVLEIQIKLSIESRVLLPTKEWQNKVEEIEKNGKGLIKIISQADQGIIIILCTDQWEGLVREYIEDFMLSNTIYEESLNLEPAMMRYLQINCANDLQNVGIYLQEEKVNLVINNTGIVVKAPQTGLNKAKFAIDKLVMEVEKHAHSINKVGIRKHMESSSGQEKLRRVEKSEGVVIEVSDESASDEDTSGSWLTTGAKRQELAVCVTKEGKKISAMVVDMLELDVDVIVNPANKDMKHIGGIAKFIVEKGGRSIQDECNNYVRKKGRLMEGQVFLSAAGNLKCKGVIHAVGPVWQNGTNHEEEYIREAVFKSLEVTSERRLTSIAFPVLCTGVFGYSVREATRVIVVAVRDFFKENFGSPVKAVYLCDVKEDNVNGFVTAMKRELKDVTVKAPQHGSQWKSGKTTVPAGRKTVKAVPVAAGNITIHIVKGQISKQKVDVVVNTTFKDLNLGNGAVSASLLKAGGPILQQECDQNYPQGIQHGDVALTSGGNLYCQSICHGSLPGWDQKGEALKVLRAFMEKCLAHVDQNQHSSVAFPAMGTGNLGYPRETVAKEMFCTVHNFGSNNPSTTISDVYFVLYDRDTETVKAFETEERRQGGGGGGSRHGRQLGLSSQNRSSGQSSGKSDPGADIWGKARKAPRPAEDMRSVTLVVYGKDVNQIKKAIRIIEDEMDDIFRSKVYSESIIKQFSTSQKSEILNLQKAYDVDVSLETRIGRITVCGLIEDVMNASDKVHQMIRKAEAIQQENQAAEMMAAMVEWCFLDAGSNPSKLEKYPPNINLQLEKALRTQEPKTSFYDSQGVKYIVDFTTYDEYPESNPSDSVKVIRKSKIDGSSFEIPQTWTSMDSKENVSVVTLLQNSQEYQDVQNDFVQSTGHTIVKIDRIQNEMLLQQYEAKLKLLEGQNPAGTTNERKLWHGTSDESVASINTYGFNRSYCGKNAVVDGNGVYFAVNSSYSARDQYSPKDFNRNKRIYRCRVLTGEFCQGAQGMKVPPNKPNTGAGTTHILYDSVVDNVRKPEIFVIFNDTQAYPEYLITFQ